MRKTHKLRIGIVAAAVLSVPVALAQDGFPANSTPPIPAGIPVTSPLVLAKCSGCHSNDGRGNLTRISWIRTTPEGWQEAVKRMMRLNGVKLTPEEARAIVKSLSDTHGLAPDEAKPVMYMAERRIIDEDYPTPWMRQTCGSCHALGRPLQWRRTKQEWELLVNMHLGYFPDAEGAAFRHRGPPAMGPDGHPEPEPSELAVDYFGKNYGLRTPEWTAWETRVRKAKLDGKWLISAHSPGHGDFVGEMNISRGNNDEFTTQIKLQPIHGGPAVERTGHAVLYAGYSWRGRDRGTPSSKDANAIPAELKETMWMSPDGTGGFGRWFWGDYNEFGFDVKLTPAQGSPMLISTDTPGLKAGSQAQRVRIYGDSLPSRIAPADLDFGSGISVKRILSNSPSEVVAEVDVASNAALGRRDLALGRVVLPKATAVYDRVDYIKVAPEDALARLGGDGSPRPKGYAQFEVVAYSRGPDGKEGTADDIELGPADVNWSIEEFYESFDDDDKEFVGYLNSEGLFTPAIDGSNPQRKHLNDNRGNVWVVATAKSLKDRDNQPLTAKSYLVVAPPLYIMWDRETEP